MRFFRKSTAFFLLLAYSGCAMPIRQPYQGVNAANPQFERGISVPPLDMFGDLLSKFPQLLLWNRKYGNHQVTPETEAAVARFIDDHQLKDVKVRINQWAPHKEIARLVTNPHIGWPYKILFFPSTLITSIIARPFSGLLISDYYDPASNSIHIFSDDAAIGLHEAGHAWDFSEQEYKGTYSLARIVPGVNLFQEGMATEEAMIYLEKTKQYDELLRAYRVLYPAYGTYVLSYFSLSFPAYIGGVLIGHWVGRSAAKDKAWQLEVEGKMPVTIEGIS